MKTDKSKHKFLLGLHEWFKNQREKCVSTGAIPKIRVTQNVVSKILLESDPPVINRLIKEKINPHHQLHCLHRLQTITVQLEVQSECPIRM